MSEEIKNGGMEPEDELIEEGGIYTLTDVETGEEHNFELLGQVSLDGNTYMAFIPADEESDEYVILKAIPTEDGDTDLVDIEDDEEFDRVVDYFEDEYFSDVDYDADGAED